MSKEMIYRDDAIDAAKDWYNGLICGSFRGLEKRLKSLPPAQPDIAEKLYLYKCYITDKEGLQHEVIHTGDIRRVTGWEI